VPRDRYTTQVRQKMEAVIEAALHSTAIESQIQLSDSALARVHMTIRLPQSASQTRERIDVAALETRIAETVRTWADRLREALIPARGEVTGRDIAARYANAFPAAYQEDVAAEMALADLTQLEEVANDVDRLAMRLTAGEHGSVHLRLFRSA